MTPVRPDFEAIVVKDVEQCNAMIHKFLTGVKFVGFDCEWIGKKKTSLIQISTDRIVILFRINCMSHVVTEVLEQFLADASVYKFGVSITRDGEKLWSDFKVKLHGKVDLRQLMTLSKPYLTVFWTQIQEFEKELGRKKQFNPRFDITEERKRWKPKMGLKSLASELLGVQMDKAVELRAGNWNTSVLSAEQTRYAALDAWAALKIAQCLATPDLKGGGDKSELESTLEKMSSVMVDRVYSDRTDHLDLLQVLSQEFPQFKMKEYVPGKPSPGIMTKALQRRLNKEKVMNRASSGDEDDDELRPMRKDKIPSHHQQTCY